MSQVEKIAWAEWLTRLGIDLVPIKSVADCP